MSIERDIINTTNVSDSELKERFEKDLKRKELKSRLVTVLDRGLTGDRLHVELPPDVYGEWVPNDKMEIYRMQSMGYSIDKIYASKRALHSDGTEGTSIVADAIFMTCPMENKELIDEIKIEQYNTANSPRGGKQKEELDFMAEARNVGLPSEMKSRVDPATIESIKDALTSTT